MTPTEELAGPLVVEQGPHGPVAVHRDRPRSLHALLRAAATRWPSRTAVEVLERGRRLSWAVLDERVTWMAACLRAAVPGPDGVALAARHGLDALVAGFVASRAGVALLLLPPDQPGRWEARLEAADVRVVVGRAADRAAVTAAGARLVDEAALWPVAGGAGGSHHVSLASGSAWAAGAVAVPGVAPPADDEDRAVLCLGTSGTTGVPKTTQVSSRGLIAAALGYVAVLGLAAVPPERSLVVLPLASIGPHSAQATAMALVGGTLVLPADPAPADGPRLVAEHDVTHLDAVPAWLTAFARAGGDAPPPAPALRTCIFGGAPMPPTTLTRLAAGWPTCTFTDVWGLSETHGPATTRRHVTGTEVAAGDVGTPLPGVEVVALGRDGTPLGADERGELGVRGAVVTPGYLDREGPVVNGWLRTGDLGLVTANGGVRLLDRAKDVVLRGGHTVFSVEVEQVLAGADAVEAAAVVGVADAVGGEAVAALVVLHAGAELDVADLRARVSAAIGPHAVPRRLQSVANLPRNATGKIDKESVRAMLEAARAPRRGGAQAAP